MKIAICFFLGAAATSLALAAEPVTIPQASPGASVSQMLGTTRIEVTYHRPGVKGRVIWGDLVPYGKVWRLGANEATMLSFTDPAWINGKEIPAGTYSLHALPGPDVWTFIVNKVAKQWGSYSYDEKDDLLRFEVKPEAAAATEWMQFAITPLAEDKVEVELRWDKLRLAFPIQVKVREITWARIDSALGAAEVDPGSWQRAANYALTTKERVKDGLGWIEKALAAKRTAMGLESKAKLLALDGRKAEAITTMQEARKLGETDMPPEFLKRVDATLAEWQAVK